METFNTVMFVLMNLVAAVCCVAIGPRGPRQTWRWFAAAGFGLAVLASVTWPLATLILRSNPSFQSYQTILNGYYAMNILLGLISTGLTAFGVLAGRRASRSQDPGNGYYPGQADPFAAQPYYAPQPSYPPQQSYGPPGGYSPPPGAPQ